MKENRGDVVTDRMQQEMSSKEQKSLRQEYYGEKKCRYMYVTDMNSEVASRQERESR